MRTRSAIQGFTIIELVIVITITGIVAAVLALIVRGPISGYFAQNNRAALVDQGQQALNEMTADIRTALPNSVRVNGAALELIPTLDGGRYRDGPSPCPAACPQPATYYRLTFNNADTDFNLLGSFQSVTTAPSGARLVIYNLGQPGADAYAGDSVMTSSGTTITLSTNTDLGSPTAAAEQHVKLTPGFKFAFPSPNKRIFLVSTPVSYVCSGSGTSNGNGTGSLNLYTGYGFTAAQQNPPSGGTSGLVADHISACSFTYNAGTSSRNGLVTLNLSITNNSETVNLIQQVHVDNAP